MKVIFDLLISRHRSHVYPVEGEIFRRRQQVFDGHTAVVASSNLIGQEDGMLPVVVVKHLLESVGDTRPGAADSHDRVIDAGVVQVDVAAPLRIEGGVPVGRHVAYSDACCIGNRTINDLTLIHDLLFLPISTIESRVSSRVITHSRGLFTLEWTHPAIQACLFHTTMVME